MIAFVIWYMKKKLVVAREERMVQMARRVGIEVGEENTEENDDELELDSSEEEIVFEKPEGKILQYY